MGRLTGRGGVCYPSAAAGQLLTQVTNQLAQSVGASTCDGPVVLLNPLLECLPPFHKVDVCGLRDLFHVLDMFQCLIHRRLLATVQAEQTIIVPVEADKDQTLEGPLREDNEHAGYPL